MERDHWIPANEWPQLVQRVCMAQADMEEPAKLRFDEESPEHLMTLIRLTIEFHHYLQSRGLGAPDLRKLTLTYVCDSVLGGVESFRCVTIRYQGLTGAIRSKLGLENILSIRASSFNERFFAMFEEFSAESNFENKCCLLLDLFKLQMVFAAVSYNWA